MSLAEKLGAIMQRPGQDPVPKDDVPWWMKYAGRGLGTVGGLLAIGLGLFNCIYLIAGDVGCLIGGMWQMVAGFICILIEAPCCCMFVDFVQNLSDWVEKRPYWNRGAFYIIISLPGIFLCFSISSIFGSGLIFTTGVIYGLMALGKKASQDEMRSAAIEETSASASSGTMHSTLVDDAQPMSYTIPSKTAFDGGV